MGVIPERLLVQATGVTEKQGREAEAFELEKESRSVSERLLDLAVGERMTEDVLHDEKASADEVRRFCENEERALTEFVMEQTSREIEERLPEIRLTWSDNDRWDFSHRRFIDVTGRNPADAANALLRMQSAEPELEFVAVDLSGIFEGIEDKRRRPTPAELAQVPEES
jgi:hypothetical protein